MRRFVSLLVLAALALPATAAAEPVRSNVPADLTGSSVTADVLVHFRTAGTGAITQATADAIAGAAQTAVQTYVSWGLPMPPDDGDGRIDIYIFDLEKADAHGDTYPDRSTTDSATAYIRLQSSYDKLLRTVKHEVMHVVQFGMTKRMNRWLEEATATWAAYTFEPADGYLGYYRNSGISLDCLDTTPGGPCYDGGYARWLFFTSFDTAFVREVFERTAALGRADHQLHGFDALLATLAAHNVTLQDALALVATKMALGTLPHPATTRLLPTAAATVVPGGAAVPVTVNHAATAFVRITGAARESCELAPLTIDVAAPSGLPAATVFAQRRGASQPLAASTGVAWRDCDHDPGYVILSNGSPTADAQSFTVSARVDVPVLSDLVVAARSTLPAGRKFKLPISVTSSAAGTLLVSLSPGPLRTIHIVPGVNRTVLKLPKSFAARKAVLDLEPSVGSYPGATLSRRLRFTRSRG